MSLNNIQPSPLSDPRIVGSRAMQDADLSASGGVMQNTPIQVESTRRNPALEDTRKPKTFIPYNCKLIEESAGVYSVTVDRGVIFEHLSTAGLGENSLIIHECNNHFDGADLRKFTITVDQAVYVVFSETPSGQIDPLSSIQIQVGANDLDSFNFVPSTSPAPPAQSAIYRYKIAELVSVDSTVRLKRYLAGSNIFKQSGLTADFRLTACQEYDISGNPIGTPIQLGRLIFVSGVLVKINASLAEWPEMTNIVKVQVPECTSTGSMP